MRFDHIGVVVDSLAGGRALLHQCFGIKQWTVEFRDSRIGVYAQFGRDESGVCYELIAPISASSPVSRALRDGVNIINHVAYRVSDLAHETERLVKLGLIAVGPPTPAVAYDNAHIQFLASESRLLLELIEHVDHRHTYF